jgi:hypothetical protein
VSPLLSARVTTELGESAEIGSFALGGPLLVVFLRHFACPGCSRFTLKLAPRLPELCKLGVRTLVIGSGSPERLRVFADRVRLRGPGVALATDPTLAAYRAAGLERSFLGTYGPRAFFGSIALYAQGHWVKRDRDDGDVEQQGGVHVVDVDGTTVLAKRDRDLLDHVSMSDVVAKALELAMRNSDLST